jgi:prepilin-type N-terminal cleavage/methylation domain-containing protein
VVRTVGTTDRTTAENSKTTESAHAFTEDGGFTLVEILIAIVLIAAGVLAVLQAWQFGIESSDRHRSQADVQNVLTSASERIIDPTFQPWTVPATQCAPDDAVPPPARQAAIVAAYQDRARLATLPAEGGWTASTITVDAVRYWNGGDSGTIWGPTCFERSQSATLPKLRMYQVTVTVRSPDGKASGTLEVVKSGV